MKALILVGGFGTQLRPLTLSKPKPLIDFANRPQLQHLVEALVKVGVREIVLAIAFSPTVMEEFLRKCSQELDVKITCSQEREPLGTAGPIAYARDVLRTTEPFFVLNSDVTCTFPLAELLAFHKNHGREGTMLVTKVEEPSRYGVVVHDADGKISRFVEKPKQYAGNHVNAGIYVFSPAVLDRIKPQPTSLEKEIFPAMAQEGHLYCMPLQGKWMGIETPRDFLAAVKVYLHNAATAAPGSLSAHDGVEGNAIIDATATIGSNCVIGPDVVIGPEVVLEEGVRVERSVLMRGARVKHNTYISDSIVGWSATVGEWARVENVTVLGEEVQLGDELYVNGGLVLPHKQITASVTEPKIIM
mmetsp:Transcript_1650/g.5376  ORF Transcript_1650/g.5376 Transcript_1650/m.5376 type:complete len:359 (+) Transcript_1650:141-1217(+)